MNATAASPADRPVYVVDDDAGIRLTVVDLLEDMGNRAWAFAGGADLLETLDDIEPGCLLLDIRMPGITGFEVMERLLERGCEWPIIAMTGHGDVPMAVQAMKLGALEFIEKPFAPHVLREATERGLAKLAQVEERRVVRTSAANRLKVLTPRERSVLNGLLEGKQNKTLAFALGLSVRTVEMHRSNLLGKLGLRTPQEAVALLAQANGALDALPQFATAL